MKGANIILCLACVLFVLWGRPAYAQDEAVWHIRCEAESGAEQEKQYCEMFQRLVLMETGERLAEMAIGFPAHITGAYGRAVIAMPLGVLLPEGGRLSVDGAAAYRFDYRYCTHEGCFAYIRLSDALLTQLRQGGVARIVFFMPDGQAVHADMSLTGFTAAYNRIAP